MKGERNYELVQNISVVDYSDKCIAVIGETKRLKEGLKRLGGKFNPFLTCGPGWIFQKKKRADVEAFINKYVGKAQLKQLLLF